MVRVVTECESRDIKHSRREIKSNQMLNVISMVILLADYSLIVATYLGYFRVGYFRGARGTSAVGSFGDSYNDGDKNTMGVANTL